LMLSWKRAMCCSRHTHSTQACDQGIVWTTGECELRFHHALAFISLVWSPFRGCGASLRSIALGADFMNPKHHIHRRRCVGIAGSIQILGMRLLFLHVFTFLQIALRFITLRAKPMFWKNPAHAFQRPRLHVPCPFSSQIPPSHIRQACMHEVHGK
jgi:hypothetical protein